MTEEAGPPSFAPPPSGPPVGPYPVSGGLPARGMVPGAASNLAAVTPPREPWRPPRRVDPLPGTPFGLVHLAVPPVTSGLAVGALTAGVASVVLSMLVVCFGVAGANGGWGGWVAGAFAVLGGLVALAGIVLGVLARRQIDRAVGPSSLRFTGRGLAIAGTSCGAGGLGLTLLALLAALLLRFG